MKEKLSWSLTECEDALQEIISHQLLVEAAYEKIDSMYMDSDDACRSGLDKIGYFLTAYRDVGIGDRLSSIIGTIDRVRAKMRSE
jgi:hypothetical protein